jgi:stage V sporulation protein SpoVS
LAHERFGNLAAVGILGRRCTGQPIDPGHVEIAIKFLSCCRRTKKPAVHSHDLRRAIGKGASQGAVIAAAIALGFDARSWMGTQMFVPGAMINVVLP